MRYEGMVYRPPSEAYSLIVQITIGCSHNRCTFCSMYRDKKFRVRDVKEVIEDLRYARMQYSRVDRIFLADGDALCLSNDKLLYILKAINELFPECSRVGIYGSAKDALRKTPEELRELKANNVGIIYIGAESGSDQVLKAIEKGSDARELIEGVRKIEDSGIMASVTFISGMAGLEGYEEHAIKTGEMISKMEPSYASLLTLMVEPQAPLYKDIQEGRFQVLKGADVIKETLLLVENINVTKKCIFRSNHASNYLSLKGNLPEDKEKMIEQLKAAIEDTSVLKFEGLRRL